jgi:hypothetical protein
VKRKRERYIAEEGEKRENYYKGKKKLKRSPLFTQTQSQTSHHSDSHLLSLSSSRGRGSISPINPQLSPHSLQLGMTRSKPSRHNPVSVPLAMSSATASPTWGGWGEWGQGMEDVRKKEREKRNEKGRKKERERHRMREKQRVGEREKIPGGILSCQ